MTTLYIRSDVDHTPDFGSGHPYSFALRILYNFRSFQSLRGIYTSWHFLQDDNHTISEFVPGLHMFCGTDMLCS